MNWIDVVVLLILVAFVAIGFWKGLVFSVLSLFSGFINFVIAIFLTRPVTNLLNNWFGLERALTGAFSTKLASMSAGFQTNLVGMSSQEISSHVATTLKEANFPFKNIFRSMLRISPDAISSKTSLTLNDILSRSLGSFFALVIGFVIIFLIILLVLFLIGLISKKANQVDGIRITDRILGVVFGLVRGAIFISFIFGILSFFNENGALAPVFDYIKSSSIGSWIYSNVNTLVDKYLNFRTLVNVVKG